MVRTLGILVFLKHRVNYVSLPSAEPDWPCTRKWFLRRIFGEFLWRMPPPPLRAGLIQLHQPPLIDLLSGDTSAESSRVVAVLDELRIRHLREFGANFLCSLHETDVRGPV